MIPLKTTHFHMATIITYRLQSQVIDSLSTKEVPRCYSL